MAKICIDKILVKQFFLYFFLFSNSNQESNIFQNKLKNPISKLTNYVKNIISDKRKIENKENIVTVIAKGKEGEEISILNDFFYPPSKVFINDSKENLGQINKVNLIQDGENEITIIWDYEIPDCEYMFSNCISLISIDISKFDSSLIISMEGMFYGCSNLSSIALTNFNTSSVTHMNYCFQNCYHLKNLDLSKINTTSTQSFIGMFYECYSLTSIDVSKFNTTSVQDFSLMFYNCSSLTSLSVSKFDTSSVTMMYRMF